MCGLLAVPCSGLLCGLGKETASPALLAGADTALSSGALSPNGKGEGELEPFCVDFREPQLGRDGHQCECEKQGQTGRRDTIESPGVGMSWCHLMPLFSRGSQGLGFPFPFGGSISQAVQQIGSTEVIMLGLG